MFGPSEGDIEMVSISEVMVMVLTPSFICSPGVVESFRAMFIRSSRGRIPRLTKIGLVGLLYLDLVIALTAFLCIRNILFRFQIFLSPWGEGNMIQRVVGEK